MALSLSPFLPKLPLMVITFLVLTNAYGTLGCNYASIISFGDSLADTGNSLRIKDCKEYLGRSLFLVGEIGGNDYNYPFFGGKSVEVIQPLVPKVIDAISSAITMLTAHGAATLLVPGNLPIGCAVGYLTIFKSQNKDDYDPQTGCLNWLNEFSQYHNTLLQKELDRLQTLYPNTSIVYADYYNASMLFYSSPDQYGFSGSVDKACCGGGDSGSDQLCGSPGANICSNSSSYVSWDGLHLTEAAYRWMAMGFIQGPYIVPHVNLSCVSLSKNLKVAY